MSEGQRANGFAGSRIAGSGETAGTGGSRVCAANLVQKIEGAPESARRRGDGHDLRFAVIGDPIAHSLSPLMHRAALAHLGVRASYEPVRVAPDGLGDFLATVRAGAFSGLNVTIPHKAGALEGCDQVDLRARAVGAVNTIVRDASGELRGANTDADGFLDDLRDHGVRPVRALVIGAGGAARAAVYALRSTGVEVMVAARRLSEAEALAQALQATACTFDELETRAAPFDLVVQTTPCGMSGGPAGDAIAALLDRLPRTPNATAYDMIYRPRVTPFLARARTLGMVPIDGVGMLAGQGARALAAFLGRALEDDVRGIMARAVEEALRERGAREPPTTR